MPLTLDEIDRYHRQMLLPEWGAAGQERVRAARVLLVGDGAAAQAAWRYLTGAGVGLVERRVEAVAEATCEAVPATGEVRLVVPGDREALGSACAVEGLKVILRLPHRTHPALPDPGAA